MTFWRRRLPWGWCTPMCWQSWQRQCTTSPVDLVLNFATAHPLCVFPLVHRFFPTLQLWVTDPVLTRIGPDATACTPVILLGHGHLSPAQRQKTTCMSPALTAPGTQRTGTGTGLDGRDGHMLYHSSVDNKSKGKSPVVPWCTPKALTAGTGSISQHQLLVVTTVGFTRLRAEAPAVKREGEDNQPWC